MNYRYPRLQQSVAERRLNSLQNGEQDLRHSFTDSEATPVETGTVVPETELKAVRGMIEQLTTVFPSSIPASQVAQWDSVVGTALYKTMSIVPADASHTDVWSFVTLVLLPDFAAWRYPKFPRERFIGTSRNVFRRLWWRQHILGELEVPEGCRPLGEDEMVAIFERTKMARDHRLVKLLACEILAYRGSARSAFARKLTIKVRALTGSTLLELISDDQLASLIREASLSTIIESNARSAA